MATIKQIKDTEGNIHDILSTIGYGTCTTASATAAKVATIDDTSWTLKVGSVIGIKYTYSNMAGSITTPVTLNVNGTGAKNIWYNNAIYKSANNNICGYANRVIYYMYDGTYWVWMNSGALDGNSDTKTSSSNKTGTKLYLVGATTQSTSGLTTYSNSNCYVGTDDCLYSGGKKVLVDGNEHSSMLSVNYLELKNLRDNGQLIPGQQYRIIDYVTTVSLGLNEISAGNVFDIIVTADSENILNEEARAIQNDNDTYFNNSNLSAWKIWYSLDNDEDRFNWANEDGYGVIYRMIDEYGNDCPYDFKNIQFKVDDKYFYTFTFVEAEDLNGLVYDISCKNYSYSGSVYNNVINRYILNNIQYLNNITFISYVYKSDDEGYHFGYNFYNNTFGNDCYSNTFGNNCDSNTFGDNCQFNTFGNDCNSNTFGNGCDSNTFGNNCYNNTFSNDCYYNKFSNNCYGNTFGNSCLSNTFGDNCQYNTFVNECNSNTFGNNCYRNTFGNNCQYNTFGNECQFNKFGNNCESNIFGHCCSDNKLDNKCKGNILKGASYVISKVGTYVGFCIGNTFGLECRHNILDNQCNYNEFGDSCGCTTPNCTGHTVEYDDDGNMTVTINEECGGNVFGINCASNTFGNNCGGNTFGNTCHNNKFGVNCHNNKFGDICNSNTFSNDCDSNKFGDNCHNNKFGDICHNNKFGDICNSHTFGFNCDDNTFGVNCNSNTFGDKCYSNTFGTKCDNNTFGTKCYNNIFGTVDSNNELITNAGSCSRNKFGANCYNNKLSNSCQNNSFDIDCHDNEFGVSCTYNKFDTLCAVIKFGSGCSYNTLGNGCIHITFGTSSALKSYYRRIIIDNGNQYIYLNCTKSTGTGSYYQNVRIGLCVNNTSTYKTISDGNTQQTFETNYKPSESQTILI